MPSTAAEDKFGGPKMLTRRRALGLTAMGAVVLLRPTLAWPQQRGPVRCEGDWMWFDGERRPSIDKRTDTDGTQQTTSENCGAAVAQVFLRYHGIEIDQAVLSGQIRDRNTEGSDTIAGGFSSDPDGMSACLNGALSGVRPVAYHAYQNAGDVLRRIAYNLTIPGIDGITRGTGLPSLLLASGGGHWISVDGARLVDLNGNGSFDHVAGFWVTDPTKPRTDYRSLVDFQRRYLNPVSYPWSKWFGKIVMFSDTLEDTDPMVASTDAVEPLWGCVAWPGADPIYEFGPEKVAKVSMRFHGFEVDELKGAARSRPVAIPVHDLDEGPLYWIVQLNATGDPVWGGEVTVAVHQSAGAVEATDVHAVWQLWDDDWVREQSGLDVVLDPHMVWSREIVGSRSRTMPHRFGKVGNSVIPFRIDTSGLPVPDALPVAGTPGN